MLGSIPPLAGSSLWRARCGFRVVRLRDCRNMGLRGKPSSHPSGVGHTTAKGYHATSVARRTSSPLARSHRLVHDLVWEAAHGPLPPGFHVHHRNEDKQDNRLENLELLSALDHKRTHSRNFRRGSAGEWECRCGGCRVWKPATGEHFYLTREGWIERARCRPCRIREVMAARAARRARGI